MGIAERFKRIVIERMGVPEGKVTLDARFTDDLGADSLDLVGLIMFVE